MLALLALVSLLPQQPEFVVKNPTDAARSEVLRVSLPLPRGEHRGLKAVRVAGHAVPCMPLLRWPDGSLQLVQLHVPTKLAPRESKKLAVDLGGDVVLPEKAARWRFEGELPFFTEVEDPWGQVYRARFVPDERAGPKGLVRATSLLKVRRYRSRHVRKVGADQPEQRFLGLVAWLTTFADSRHAELSVLLDNGAHEPDLALGPVRFQRFSLCSTRADVRFLPRWRKENLLRPPTERKPAGYRQDLLGPVDQLYLGDRTAKAFRIDLFLDDAKTTAAERETAKAISLAPLWPLPTLAWTRHTKAFGVHGGPAPLSVDSRIALEATFVHLRWRSRAVFGPFGGFGDVRDASSQGTPRNGPFALHNVLRWSSSPLLQAADGMVLQQTLRPTPGWSPRLPEDMALFRQGMSKRSLTRPHGFTPLSYEHFSVDVLADFYWFTGDPLACAELERAGSGLLRLLAGLPFVTCRGEGWCMQAAARIARATADDRLLRTLHARFVKSIRPKLGPEGAAYVLRQPGMARALGEGIDFDAPWQMAALVHGLAAMHAASERLGKGAAEIYRTHVLRTARTMAGPGWAEGKGPKYLVSVRDKNKFVMPIGYGPLEGTALFEVGAFALAAGLATNAGDRERFLRRASQILLPYQKADPRMVEKNRWFQIHLDRFGKAR